MWLMSQNLFRDPGTWRIWWLDGRNILHWVDTPASLFKWFGPQPQVVDQAGILNIRAIGANITLQIPPAIAESRPWSYTGLPPQGGRLLRGWGTYHYWWLDRHNEIHWVTSPALVQRYWGSMTNFQWVPLHTLDYYAIAPNIDHFLRRPL
jgi:hypothetical protein